MKEVRDPSKGELINAMLLVGGTCIGGGMLALPVGAGVGGYFPSVIWLFITWAMMTCTSLLLLEVNLWMKEGEHIISMAKRFLGPIGQALTWILYLYISYASLVSYAAGGGDLFTCSTNYLWGFCLSRPEAIISFTLAFTFLIYLGAKFVGRINTIFFIGMLVSYFFLTIMGIDDIKPELLLKKSWFTSLFALPLLLTSFSHQTMVPSLTPYLKRNPQYLKWAVIGGTSIALVIYLIWLTLVLGIVPVEGENGLIEAYTQGVPATQFVNENVTGYWMIPLMNFFSLFAIVTSFLGIAFGLFDFLSDGLKIKKTKSGKILLGLLLIIPVIFFATYYKRAFLVAMETTGGIGDALLNGLLPITMVWIGRYYRGYKSALKLPGGRPILSLLALAFSSILVLEIVMLSTNIVYKYLTP
ncbi:hypothetical protein N9Y92_01835 [Chlamydiales bacterium]|nr:hypothetical protein [Chlamydiales bacterium]